MDNKIKSALDAAGTAADYSARATYQRGYDAGVASVEAREWALGVQVVAQAERLRLADDLYQCLLGCHRCGCQHPACSWCRDDGDIRAALAKWDAVPGMEP